MLREREERDFKHLQRKYGMDEKIRQTDGIPTSSGYVKQYIDSLQRDCGRDKLTVVQLFSRTDKLLREIEGPDTEARTDCKQFIFASQD